MQIQIFLTRLQFTWNSGIQLEFQTNPNGHAAVSSVIGDNLADVGWFDLFDLYETLLETQPNECESKARQVPTQNSSRKSLLTRAIRAFRRGVVKQNFPTSQQKSILAAAAQWHPLCSGERRWSLELTAPNNMELGFGRMAVGHFRSACEITLRRKRERERRTRSRAAEREESRLSTPLQPRRLGISITPPSCRRGKCCAEHTTAPIQARTPSQHSR